MIKNRDPEYMRVYRVYNCPSASKSCTHASINRTSASKMAEVLTGEYIDGEYHIQSVTLESELTMVVREKLCIHPWISIF